jgi:hypothetical protein
MRRSFDFARPISVSPEVPAHPIKLKHQVDAKGNQYEKEMVMVEHDRPTQYFRGGWPRLISLLGPSEPDVDETLEASPHLRWQI